MEDDFLKNNPRIQEVVNEYEGKRVGNMAGGGCILILLGILSLSVDRIIGGSIFTIIGVILLLIPLVKSTKLKSANRNLYDNIYQKLLSDLRKMKEREGLSYAHSQENIIVKEIFNAHEYIARNGIDFNVDEMGNELIREVVKFINERGWKRGISASLEDTVGVKALKSIVEIR